MNGDTRFIYPESITVGFIEICVNDVWRPLCSEGLGGTNPEIVCNSLGFSASMKLLIFLTTCQSYSCPITVGPAIFGFEPPVTVEGMPIVLNPNCSGNELNILECDPVAGEAGSGAAPIECANSEYAFVVCQSMFLCSIIIVRVCSYIVPLWYTVVCITGGVFPIDSTIITDGDDFSCM